MPSKSGSLLPASHPAPQPTANPTTPVTSVGERPRRSLRTNMRPAVFICDEYQAFATALPGERERLPGWNRSPFADRAPSAPRPLARKTHPPATGTTPSASPWVGTVNTPSSQRQSVGNNRRSCWICWRLIGIVASPAVPPAACRSGVGASGWAKGAGGPYGHDGGRSVGGRWSRVAVRSRKCDLPSPVRYMGALPACADTR